MTLRPASHFVKSRPKRGPKGGEAILHLQARLDDGAGYKAIAFQLTQVLREHLMSDLGHGSLQIVEPSRLTVPEQPKDQRLPFAADNVDRQLHGAGVRLLSTR